MELGLVRELVSSIHLITSFHKALLPSGTKNKMEDIRKDMGDFIEEMTRLFKIFEKRLIKIIEDSEKKSSS